MEISFYEIKIIPLQITLIHLKVIFMNLKLQISTEELHLYPLRITLKFLKKNTFPSYLVCFYKILSSVNIQMNHIVIDSVCLNLVFVFRSEY